MGERESYWEQPDVVARFAEREPDLRLLDLIEDFERPAEVPVLDVGCAGGRNTVLLARRGFDVYAVDSSSAMVEETRERVAAVLGRTEAESRVVMGRMDDLSRFPPGSFDLVIAIGVLHNANSWTEWTRAADECTRVLRPGGRLLVSHFSPETDLTGRGVRPVAGERHIFEGLPAGRATLLHPEELDAEFARRGLAPEVPTTTGTTLTDVGRRVSVNGLYRVPEPGYPS